MKNLLPVCIIFTAFLLIPNITNGQSKKDQTKDDDVIVIKKKIKNKVRIVEKEDSLSEDFHFEFDFGDEDLEQKRDKNSISRSISITLKDPAGEEHTLEWEDRGSVPAEVLEKLDAFGVFVHKTDVDKDVVITQIDSDPEVDVKVVEVLKDKIQEKYKYGIKESLDDERVEIVIKSCNDQFTMAEDVNILFKKLNVDPKISIEKKIVIETIIPEKNKVIPEPAPEQRSEPSLSNVLEVENFKAYPNPSDGLLNVQFSGLAGPVEVSVLDMAGKHVFQESIPDFDGQFDKSLNLQHIGHGQFILSVVQNDKIFTQNLVFQ